MPNSIPVLFVRAMCSGCEDVLRALPPGHNLRIVTLPVPGKEHIADAGNMAEADLYDVDVTPALCGVGLEPLTDPAAIRGALGCPSE